MNKVYEAALLCMHQGGIFCLEAFFVEQLVTILRCSIVIDTARQTNRLTLSGKELLLQLKFVKYQHESLLISFNAKTFYLDSCYGQIRQKYSTSTKTRTA